GRDSLGSGATGSDRRRATRRGGSLAGAGLCRNAARVRGPDPVAPARAAPGGGLRFLATVRRRAAAGRAQVVPSVDLQGAPRLMIINQWVPAAHKGDAIGDSARRVRSLLRAMGHDSDVYALTID